MKIIFDYKIFYQQKIGGISNYFYNLGREMIKNEADVHFFCPLHKNDYLQKIPSDNKKGIKISFPSKFKKIIEIMNQKISEYHFYKNSPDIIHNTYYSHTTYKSRSVCTVYDMINEKFSHLFKNSDEITEIKKKTIKNCDHVLCISHKTKQDLIDLFKIEEKKISVTLLASAIDKNEFRNVKKKIFENHLLFVGSRHGYKNFEGVIKAYSISSFLKNNFKIIAYGGEKINKKDFDILKKNNVDSKSIIYLNDSDIHLSKLYQNVSALVYPSFYEGFGLPIVEAMQIGCPVISSDGGSLREVGGEGLQYFNPYSAENISIAIEQALSSKKKIDNLIEYGFTRAEYFSWSKCARETIAAYKKIL
jgi:glycosyltransferase involved in cell wall biosynthesis